MKCSVRTPSSNRSHDNSSRLIPKFITSGVKFEASSGGVLRGLICFAHPGEEREVFASLNGGQITVGTKAEDTDFESWGRKMSRAEVEREAFTFFVRLLERNGIVASPKHAA
nr:putative integron gene cassette protein [uncultured bacterium]